MYPNDGGCQAAGRRGFHNGLTVVTHRRIVPQMGRSGVWTDAVGESTVHGGESKEREVLQ